MASGITFEIRGLKQLQDKINSLPTTLIEEISGELETSCQAIVTRAKQDARKDSGTMARLTDFTGAKLSYVIFSKAKYSPYQDFGTGKYVFYGQNYISAKGVEANAAQFKGGGLRKVNIYPNSFFFKNFFLERPKLLTNISNVIKRLAK